MDYTKYFNQYTSSISNLLSKVDVNLINQTVDLIKETKQKNKKIYIVGNGGSASMASHVSVDFAKVAGVSSSTFNNANLITCFANDYNYENWVTEAIKAYCDKNDLLMLISSSGNSKNIINAAQYCKYNNMNLITFSGFKPDNDLLKLGKVNFHVSSSEYNYIEMCHHIILVSIVDIFAKKIFD